jgi:methylisocitrate lyase
MSPGSELRRLLAAGCVAAPGCFDALSALIAQRAGYSAVHVSGFAVAASQLAAPDIGLLTLEDTLGQARRVIGAVSVPVICDIDTGFGGPHNVARTVAAFERAGAAAVHLEDQLEPKRCPALEGRELLSVDDYRAKLAVARDARSDPDFLVIARTDADEIGFDELVERCNLYLEAGADMVMPMLMKVNGVRTESLPPDEQMEWHRRLVAAVDGPLLTVMIPPGRTVGDMQALGYSAVILALVSLRAAINAMASALESAWMHGTAEPYAAQLPIADYATHQDLMELLGLERYQAIDRREAKSGQ